MPPTAKLFPRAKRKYQFLLNDADAKRWHENVSRGSAVAADVYLRWFGSFFQSQGTTPKELIDLSEIDLHNLLLDLVSSMEKAGHARSNRQQRRQMRAPTKAQTATCMRAN